MTGLFALLGWALAGAVAGALYFRAVWATARLLAAGAGHGRAVGFTLVRLALLAGFLVLAARGGAGPLLAATLGFLVARFAVMRRLGRPAS